MRQRKINAAAFKRQLEEAVIGEDALVEVQASAEDSVWIRIPVNMDSGDDYLQRILKCADEEEICSEILAHKAGVTAEEQWRVWLDAFGGSPDADKKAAKLLINIFTAEKEAAEERAKNFRYRG